MTIIRRITTTIDEIDDNTKFPTEPTERADTGTSIGSPEPTNEEVFDSHSPYDSRTNQPTIGRTIADLIIELKNDYRAMAVALTVVSFLIFITKIDCIESFIYPLLAALLLNIIWFGATPLVNFSKWLKKKR